MAMSDEETFRDELIQALERELVGPGLPPHDYEANPNQRYVERLEESPTQRYSAGVLFPQQQVINEHDDQGDTEDADEASGSGEEIPTEPLEGDPGSEPRRDGGSGDSLTDAYDQTVRLANEFYPSAIGLSCLCDGDAGDLVIRVSAARYESGTVPYVAETENGPQTRERQEWRRIQIEIPDQTLSVPASSQQAPWERNLVESLIVKGMFRHRGDGSVLLTLSLLNDHQSGRDSRIRAADCFFQVSVSIQSAGGKPVFREYKVLPDRDPSKIADPDVQEEAALELLYRKRKAFAVGHGCSVDWGEETDSKVASLATVTVPRVKVPPVEPRSTDGDELNMYILSGADGTVPPSKIPSTLQPLVTDYETWIREQEANVASLPSRLKAPATENLKHCRTCLGRIRDGIKLLENDPVMLEAFMLANRAILMQQHHSRRSKRSKDVGMVPLPASYKPTTPYEGRWRTFQLAFILMNLSSLKTNDDGTEHPERDLVDLIWFPTGGGKTEAYLGLAATDIFLRRLIRPDNAGCTVLMRYTLRLLTAQQFQRASSMICACELIRRSRSKDLGEQAITIGLWVGGSLTPLYREPAVKSLNSLAKPNSQEANEFQMLKCPWCGTAMDDPDALGYQAHGKPKTVIFVCPETQCEFSTPKKRLPVIVIDDDVYEIPPTLIIGTVDKFAMLAWREMSGRIFGIGTPGDNDPPDLIIQDELHLISGPLGSVVGLYESAIDLLCSWKGRKPKIVASTATIRRAWHQCRALYDRPTSQFPPQGLDISDSFFAKENCDTPGRLYLGVFATAAPSFVTAMVRTLGGLFHACKALRLPEGVPESTRDPYWTALQYFSSLRELGHAATLIEADIPEYMWSITTRTATPKELHRSLGTPVELTSRRTADEIPAILERLEKRYPRESDDWKDRPLDTLLATNMISVGVDVDRLGLMLVVGQPKTTSEYIQASSRVGRSQKSPGLVVAMYNPGKPRDRSHYEHFRAYHEAFYKHVEPTSVTPFSLPVMERALHGVLVVLVRHLVGLSKPDQFDPSSTTLQDLIDQIELRCSVVDPEHAASLKSKLKVLVSKWSSVQPSEWGGFGKPPELRPLMYPAGSEPLPAWAGSAWATPSSMRNVDVECRAEVIASYENDE
ncbi:hypothetical protein Poly24_18070 [Rosistilla carotiformis]|uniref:Helicase C-terminal domain-containing protein n=2 Tax=Rosistilla carotiformis TaxID=2528017 RepID=A0A518JRC8_9BACT|nr:hypothetical protein Poly24_18070 [Rosistilla carotiformis]